MIRTFITPDGPFMTSEFSLSVAANEEALLQEVYKIRDYTGCMLSDVLIVDSFPENEPFEDIATMFGSSTALARLRVVKFRIQYLGSDHRFGPRLERLS